MNEGAILKTINRFTVQDLIKFVGLEHSRLFYSFLHSYTIENLNELHDMFKDYLKQIYPDSFEILAFELYNDLVQYANELIAIELEKKEENKRIKIETKLKNRTNYLPTVVMSRETFGSDENQKSRWRGFTMLLSKGLLGQIQEYETKKPAIVSFSIQNNLTPLLADNGEEVKPEIDLQTWQDLETQNILVSGNRVAWLKNTLAYEWLRKAFTAHIDLRSYNHSLNAPLLPGGFLPNADVILMTIKTLDGMNCLTDGCGRIHPEHPLFKSLNRPGGACTIQIRGINRNGTFAKGILVPDERCIDSEGNHQIWIDWKQIKGSNRALAKENIKNDVTMASRIHLGVLQAWDRPRKLKFSFQQLQLAEVNNETISVVKSWVDEAYAKLLRGGIESLFAAIAAKDEKVNLVLKICQAIQCKVPEFSPIQIPFIRSLLIERLQKTAYFLAQGAGKYTKQYVVAIDAAVPEGSCVLAGFKKGTNVLVYRYPTLLPQNLVKLKVIKPFAHHLIDKKVVRETIFLNPKDITDKSQGDSDGDIVGVTDDHRAITLYNNKIDEGRVYLIEPDSNKKEFEEAEGVDYVRSDPMGPVGQMCLLQAKALAIGNIRAAIALSVPYQESVDAGKNIVHYSDFSRAINLEEWEFENNRYTFKHRMTYDQAEMEESVNDWVGSLLASVGITYKNKKNCIAWRYPSKRIDVSKWQTTEERGNWSGGNLVHICHDYAREVWLNKYQDLFPTTVLSSLGNEEETLEDYNVDISDILSKFLSINPEFKPIKIDWKTYKRTIYQKSGFDKFNKAFYTLMQNQVMDQEDKNSLIDLLFLELKNSLVKLSIEEIECIWRMELTDTYEHIDDDLNNYYSSVPNENKKNRPHTAFRAISWEGSPILSYLNIATVKICPYFSGKSGFKADLMIKSIASLDNPFKALIDLIQVNTEHAAEIKDLNGNNVHLHECAYCKDVLYNNLVFLIRKEKSSFEYDLIRNLCKKLNK